MADLGFFQGAAPVVLTDDNDLYSTYSAAVVGLATAALATDIFTITGSATKTVKVIHVEVTGTETTSAIRDILLIKRSSANSGGTFTSPTVVPHDSNNAAGTAIVKAYTANPTLGTTIGTIRVRKVDVEATNLVGASDDVIWEFGGLCQPIVLRGTGEVLAVNLNGVTSSGSSFDISVEWTEE